MKVVVSRADYSFSATAKTVFFADKYSTLRLAQIGLITNATAGIVIYKFNSATTNGVLSGTDLVLDYDTTAMSNIDDLQIILDITDPNIDTLADIDRTLTNIYKINMEILECLQQFK